MTGRRIAAAFWLAPIACIPVFIIGNFVHLLVSDGMSAIRDLIVLAIGSIIIVLPAAYLAEGLFGIPLYFFLKKIRRLRPAIVVLAGGLIGLSVSTAVAIAAEAVEPMMFIAGSGGFVAGACWWRIANGSWRQAERAAA